MAWLADGKKKFENMFTGFDTIHERDRHRTDGQTPHDSIDHAYVGIARQNDSTDTALR